MTKVTKSQSVQKQVTYYHGSEFLQTFAENHNHIHLKHLKILGETAHQMYQKSLKCYLYIQSILRPSFIYSKVKDSNNRNV